MNETNVNQLLAQMRSMASAAQGGQLNATAAAADPATPDFSDMLKSSIDKVNETQKMAGELQTAFQRGDKGTDVADVMVAMQKASISFQAMVQVRNKLVSAYQDIMNMPV